MNFLPVGGRGLPSRAEDFPSHPIADSAESAWAPEVGRASDTTQLGADASGQEKAKTLLFESPLSMQGMSKAAFQRRLDELSIDKPANTALPTVAEKIAQGHAFDHTYSLQNGQKVRIINPKQGNEGGDKVWANLPPNATRLKDLPARPANVPAHRVITKVDGDIGDPNRLYAEDANEFLCVGYGEGQDYRTTKASLDELAKTGVTVIGVDLSKSKNAKQALELAQPIAGSNVKEIPKGSFFHLDTVFRPLPHGALVYADGVPSEFMGLLHAMYGKENIIRVSANEAVDFAANGRLVRKPDGSQVLFYKEGALSAKTLNQIAKVEGGQLHSGVAKGGYKVHEVLNEAGQSKLRMVAMPTQEAWKGGGSVSCITQFVPTKEGLAVVMMPPTDYRPNPAEALNELEKLLVSNVSPNNAWREYRKVKALFQAEGLPVIEMQPSGHPEAIYTRDGADTRTTDSQGNGHDPLQRPLHKGDAATVYVSRFDSALRRPEAAKLAQAVVDTAANAGV